MPPYTDGLGLDDGNVETQVNADWDGTVVVSNEEGTAYVGRIVTYSLSATDTARAKQLGGGFTDCAEGDTFAAMIVSLAVNPPNERTPVSLQVFGPSQGGMLFVSGRLLASRDASGAFVQTPGTWIP